MPGVSQMRGHAAVTRLWSAELVHRWSAWMNLGAHLVHLGVTLEVRLHRESSPARGLFACKWSLASIYE
jgi:hypothetical protein